MKPELSINDYPEINYEEEFIRFYKNRMLLFEVGAFSQLCEELILTLGKDIARGVFYRFGFQCGINDVNALKKTAKYENNTDLMLAGPKIHTLQGVVKSTCEEIKFDNLTGGFYMSGTWRNSREAINYLTKYGKSEEPVCWSLTGYASGFATGILEREVYCIETMCQGMGDPFCRYEIRHAEALNGEADQLIQDLKRNTVIRSLQTMLYEERERVDILKNLNKAVIDIGQSLETSSMPAKTVRYAQKLFNVEKVFLAINDNKSKKILLYETIANKESCNWVYTDNSEIITYIFNHNQPVIWNNYNKTLKMGSHDLYVKNLLGITLHLKKEVQGAFILINKVNGSYFNQNDQEFLTMLSAHSTIALSNAITSEETNQELQEKVSELYNVNNLLAAEHESLQKSTKINSQLTSFVLEGHGLDTIVKYLANIVNRPILVADNNFHVISHTQVDESNLDIKQQWRAALRKLSFKERQSLLEGMRVNIESSKNLTLVVVPVIAGENKLGFVVTIEQGDELNQIECMAMERAGTVIALELLKQKAAFETEYRLKKDFLDELLNGKPENEEVVIRRAKQLGLELTKKYRVIAIELMKKTNKSNSDNDKSIPGGFFQTIERDIKQVFKNLFLIGYDRFLIGVLTAGDAAGVNEKGDMQDDFIESIEHLLNTHYPSCKWRIGISSPSSEVLNFSHAYREACMTIEILSSLNYVNKIKRYDQLGVFGLLSIDLEQFSNFTNQIIGPLLEYDKKHNTELVETLSLYYKNNCNLQKAARLGFLNPSTMKYRLKRITEIAKIDLGNPETNLIMHLALKIIKGI